MSIEIVVFAFGALLVLTGILGGGFEVRELKIPRVGRGARVGALVSGALLVLVGIAAMDAGTPEGQNQAHSLETSPTTAKPATFTLHDELGDDELSEQLTVLVNGRNVGNLTVNEQYPSSDLSVTVPQGGRQDYMVQAKAVFTDENGDPFEYTGVGQGSINVADGKRFGVAGSTSGTTWVVSLVEE